MKTFAICIFIVFFACYISSPTESQYSSYDYYQACVKHPFYVFLHRLKIKDVCPSIEYLNHYYEILGILAALIFIPLYGCIAFFLLSPFAFMFRSETSNNISIFTSICNSLAVFASIAGETAIVNRVEKFLMHYLLEDHSLRPSPTPGLSPIGMPSGHATMSGAIVAVCFFYIKCLENNNFIINGNIRKKQFRPILIKALYIISVIFMLVAVSRVATRYHTTTQVTIGFTLGIMRACFFLRHRSSHWFCGREPYSHKLESSMKGLGTSLFSIWNPVGYSRLLGLIILLEAYYGDVVHWISSIAIILLLFPGGRFLFGLRPSMSSGKVLNQIQQKND